MRKYCIDNYGGISIVRKGFYWKKGDQRSVYFRYDLHSTVDSYLSECQNLGLLDSMWALILPGAISVYNMIIARTYFQNSIPGEMLESARLDGCDDIRVLVNMVLPLSKSILAVLVLYYAIAHWNSYFDAFIYLSSENKFTLQVVLRNIMNSVAALEEMATTAEQSMRAANIEVLKYAIIVFGSIPLIIYILLYRNIL